MKTKRLILVVGEENFFSLLEKNIISSCFDHAILEYKLISDFSMVGQYLSEHEGIALLLIDQQDNETQAIEHILDWVKKERKVNPAQIICWADGLDPQARKDLILKYEVSSFVDRDRLRQDSLTESVLIGLKAFFKQERNLKRQHITRSVNDIPVKNDEGFYQDVTRHLYHLFASQYVCIGKHDTQKEEINIISIRENGAPIDEVDEDLSESALIKKAISEPFFYTDNVDSVFPNDPFILKRKVKSGVGVPLILATGERFGFILLLGKKLLEDGFFVREFLQYYARRIVIEIERHQVELSLRDALKRLDMHIRKTPVGLIEWDDSLRIIKWNDSAENIFGYSEQEMLGKEAHILFDNGDFKETRWRPQALVMSNTETTYSKARNITKDGRLIYCNWFNTLLITADNQFVGVASMITDVTQEQKAKQALIQNEHELREILNSLVDAVITVDDEGKILSVNYAACRMFNYADYELLELNITALIKDVENDKLEDGIFSSKIIKEILKRGVDLFSLKKEGEEFAVHVTGSILPGSQMNDRRFIFSVHDLTEYREQEQRLRRAQKLEAMGNLTGGIAHDFNNLLGVIQGYSDFISTLLLDNKIIKYVDEIQKTCSRGEKLTSKLLSFSRQTSGHMKEEDMNTVLLENRDMLEKSLTPRIELVLKLEKSLWPVFIDRADFEDALLNIAINAMHAIEGGGRFTIQTENISIDSSDARSLSEGDYVLVSLSDTGKGMSEQTLQKVFDPFFSTKGDRGSGLGLSQVYGFVERSKGDIQIRSVCEQGTTVVIHFPRSSAVEKADVTQNVVVPSPAVNGERILVVDDEQALLNITAESLAFQGYKITKATSAEEALNILETTPVDLMISDIVMPGMDGYALADKVRMQYPKIKILLASGFYEKPDCEREVGDNGISVISKPYTLDTLLSRMKETLAG